MLLYMHVLFLFWLAMIIVWSFEAQLGFCFKSFMLRSLVVVLVVCANFVSILLNWVAFFTKESCFAALRLCLCFQVPCCLSFVARGASSFPALRCFHLGADVYLRTQARSSVVVGHYC